MTLPNTTTPPLSWREIEQIPGIIPVSALEISPRLESNPVSVYAGRLVEIRWKKTVGLDWFSYKLTTVARVYGETHVLLEKMDGSQGWHALTEIKLIKLHPTEIREVSR